MLRDELTSNFSTVMNKTEKFTYNIRIVSIHFTEAAQ